MAEEKRDARRKVIIKQLNDLDTEYWDVVESLKNPTPRVTKGSRRASATSVKKVTNVMRASNAFGGGAAVASSYPSSGYTAR